MTDVAGLAERTALVTGATGFIGGALARRLRAIGATVHGVSRAEHPAGAGCDRWWQADLTDLQTVRRLFDSARPDVVFNLAGMSTAVRGVDLVLPTLQANLVAPVNLLMAAQERRIRILLTGSLEEPPPDSSWPVPSSPYAAAMLAAGNYARMFHALYQAQAICLRPFMVYGPGQPNPRKLVPYVVLSLLRGESPELSSGSRLVDWVYIDDVVEAFLRAAVTPGLEGVPLDIGSGELTSVREVVEELVRIIHPAIGPRLGAIGERALEQVRVADVKATFARLGWKPTTPLRLGLEKTVDWYRRSMAERTDGSSG